MSAFPPASADLAFDVLAQQAGEAREQSRVKIGTVEMSCEAILGPIRWEMTDGGWKLRQDLEIWIRKELTDCPAMDDSIIFNGKGYGISALDQSLSAWHVMGFRRPGKDESPGSPPSP